MARFWLAGVEGVDMTVVTLRPARPEDMAAIRGLIRRSRINPTGLKWERFVVAEIGGQFAGCGQLKPHSDGTLELASIAVETPFRGQGLAAEIIHHLLGQAPRPLYLNCRSGLQGFYEKFGFRVMSVDEMPASQKRLFRLARALMKLFAQKETLLIMALET